MFSRSGDRRTPPPNQLRRPRKPVGRAQCGHSRNKRREPQGEAPSAVWFAGWEVCFHSLGKGGFVHLFNLQAVANLTVSAVKGGEIGSIVSHTRFDSRTCKPS